jgi:DNA-binding transcriptional LysR family regulator
MKQALSLEALQVLDSIDRKGSFAAAAAELHRVPSAVTYAVQKLEQDLGVALYDRSGHRARLTAAGEELLKEGRQLLRAADELECRVKRAATGWETELRIAYDDIIPIESVYPLMEDFYRANAARGGTRLRLTAEVLAGSWDALVSGRADLVIGAPGDGPAGGGYTARPLPLNVEMVFVVARDHPLAKVAEPLRASDILAHRAISVADSSRDLPPRTVGLLSGQDVLTVPNMRAKAAAQIRGLGVGYLPLHIVLPDLQAGRMVLKQIEDPRPAMTFYTAWHTNQPGKALRWFIKRIDETRFGENLLGSAPKAVPTRTLHRVQK